MAKLKRDKYEDDDDIDKALKQFATGQQTQPDPDIDTGDNPPEKDSDEADQERADAEKALAAANTEAAKEVKGRQMPRIRIEEDDDGTTQDIDAIDADAPKTIKDSDIIIPECACCGNQWFIENGRIMNGCGCRIHKMCRCKSGKCEGHCTCKIQPEQISS